MKLTTKLCLLFTVCSMYSASVFAQNYNRCDSAISLCNSLWQNLTTGGGTANTGGIADPALPFPCTDGVVNRSKWFTVEGIATGSSTITVSQINNNPGLEMQIYTGTCGTLAPIVGKCNKAVGPGGSMSVTFATTTGTTYYIMVDGTSGNSELFNITSSGDVKGRPVPVYTADSYTGCVPLTSTITNWTDTNGTPITYSWELVNNTTGSTNIYPSFDPDTTFTFIVPGDYDLTLHAINDCGEVTFNQNFIVQELQASFSYQPNPTCVGMPIKFTASAQVVPNPPYQDPNVTQYSWDFGDPGSGANNTATVTEDTITHVFVGPGTTFTVTLIIDGYCGPDSDTVIVNLLPPVTVNAGNDTTICQGTPAILNATVTNGSTPITYLWTGAPTIVSAGNPTTNVTGTPILSHVGICVPPLE